MSSRRKAMNAAHVRWLAKMCETHMREADRCRKDAMPGAAANYDTYADAISRQAFEMANGASAGSAP
ncbi:hypothetical protein [Stenotrophomonas sp. NPDC078853]|uniref:hypothetical protein n=1 Tax=Stenotrophomonas sp. NPDC078853 TaxID=3364534 RepID=UPI00384B15FB